MREVAAALSGASTISWALSIDTDQVSGLKLTKAYTYLGDVVEHKQVIPFRRFSGGVGRASQAKQFKTTQGGCLDHALTGVPTSLAQVAGPRNLSSSSPAS